MWGEGLWGTFPPCEKPLGGACSQAPGPNLQAQNAPIWSTLLNLHSEQTTVFPGAAVILGFWKKEGNLKDYVVKDIVRREQSHPSCLQGGCRH